MDGISVDMTNLLAAPVPPIDLTSAAYVDPDLLEEILPELVDEAIQYFNDLIADLFPNGQLHLMRKEGANARLASFISRTVASDLPYIEDTKYIDKYRQGVYPALQSPYWAALMAVPSFFKREQRDFLDLWRDKVVNP